MNMTASAARAAGPGRAEVALAVPAGSRRIRGYRAERVFLDGLVSWEPWQQLRADRRDNVLAVAKWLARHASYADGLTRPTRDRICELAGICVSTWKAVRRLLETWGFLACVTAGTTPEFSPGVLRRPDDPNTAAVYVLCLPRKPPALPAAQAPELTRPPTVSRRDAGTAPRAHARGETPETRNGPASGGTPPEAAARGAAAAMAGLMRKAAGKTISDGWSAWIARPFTAAGWTPRDLLWAIDHPPGDHGQHRLSARVRHPVGWLRWRLGLWLAGDGTALPSLSQLRAAAAAKASGEAARLRELTGGRAARLAGQLDDQAAAVARKRMEARHMRWIQYPIETDRRKRRNGRRREGQRWQDGPKPGLVWTVPADLADRLYVLVHCFPGAPENNYAVDGEQR